MSIIINKLKTCCGYESKVDNQIQPLLPVPSDPNLSEIPDRKSTIKNCIAGGVALGSSAGIALSSLFLRSVFNDFTTTCAAQLNTFSPALAECRDPFQQKIILYESILMISSFALGYICQRFWEYKPDIKPISPGRINSPIIKESLAHRVSSKIKYSIAYLQTTYSYEASLGIGYLFNGVWIVTTTQPAWFNYFNCQAAAIGIGSSFLGMYIRMQQLNMTKAYRYKNQELTRPQIKKHWKMITISSIAGAIFSLTFIPQVPFTLKARIVTREVSAMVFMRPFGYFTSTWLDYKHHTMPLSRKAKVVSIISTMLNMQSPLIFGGYYTYLNTSTTLPRLAGVMIIGLAEGIKDGRYHEINYSRADKKEKAKAVDKKCQQILPKILGFVKNYWGTATLLSFTVVMSQLHLFKCESIAMYICPISIELSGNYLNADGKGINIVIISGLVDYHARKILKYIYRKTTGYSQKIASGLLQLSDKYQFDLLSCIPYAIIQSGVYIKDYDAFASYNPLAVLILMGATLGTYKEQANSEEGIQTQPAFTNLGVIMI